LFQQLGNLIDKNFEIFDRAEDLEMRIQFLVDFTYTSDSIAEVLNNYKTYIYFAGLG